jgi:hypothetical protein
MTESEKFVRDHWEEVEDYQQNGEYISLRSDHETVSNWHSWDAAANFTRNRLEEIRQVEEEIKALIQVQTECYMRTVYILERLLSANKPR